MEKPRISGSKASESGRGRGSPQFYSNIAGWIGNKLCSTLSNEVPISAYCVLSFRPRLCGTLLSSKVSTSTGVVILHRGSCRQDHIR